MYRIRESAYTGCSPSPVTYDDETEARDYIARLLLRRRRQGFPVVTLKKGQCWEVCERDDCMLIPDECGTVSLACVTFQCRECGGSYDTVQAARGCCAFTYDDAEVETDGPITYDEMGPE